MDESPIVSEGELDYDKNVGEKWREEGDGMLTCCQPEFAIKIVYPDLKFKSLMSLSEIRKVDEIVTHETILESIVARREYRKTDQEYAQWADQWSEHRQKTLQFFNRSRSETWRRFKLNYKAMKDLKN